MEVLRDNQTGAPQGVDSAVLRDSSSAVLWDSSSAKIARGSLAVVIDRRTVGEVRVYTAENQGPCELVD